MAKPPEDFAIGVLRDILSTLADHTKTVLDHTRRFEQLAQRLDDVHDGMRTALGLASHAHLGDDSMKKDINELKKRIKRLEGKI